MLFEKGNELIEIEISRKNKNIGLAIFEDGQKLKIAGLEKIKSTIDRIAFLENKGFRVYI